MDLVVIDTAGPLPVLSKKGALNYLTFIDDMSRWVRAYPLEAKSDCFKALKKFQLYAERATSRRINSLQSDACGEYNLNELRDHVAFCRILHELAAILLLIKTASRSACTAQSRTLCEP